MAVSSQVTGLSLRSKAKGCLDGICTKHHPMSAAPRDPAATQAHRGLKERGRPYNLQGVIGRDGSGHITQPKFPSRLKVTRDKGVYFVMQTGLIHLRDTLIVNIVSLNNRNSTCIKETALK